MHPRRAVGDFVPATRHEPADLDLTAFLPVNNARGFGASRVLPDALTTSLTRSGRQHAVDDNALRAMASERGATLRALAFRAQELRTAGELWDAGNVKGALAVIRVAGEADAVIATDFCRAFRFETGALNLESAVLLVHITLVLLATASDAARGVAAATWAALLTAFGGFVKSTIDAAAAPGAPAPGADLSRDDRLAKCTALLTAFETFRGRANALPGAACAALVEARATYEMWRNTLPLPAVAAAARAASTGGR